jgi:hypothetical protein
MDNKLYVSSVICEHLIDNFGGGLVNKHVIVKTTKLYAFSDTGKKFNRIAHDNNTVRCYNKTMVTSLFTLQYPNGINCKTRKEKLPQLREVKQKKIPVL